MLSLTFILFDAAGRRTGVPGGEYPFVLDDEKYQAAQKGGLLIDQDRVLNDSVVKVRVIIFDRNSNTAGSVTLPVTASDRSPAP